MRRITLQVLVTTMVAFGGAVTAVSAELPPVPVHPASAAASMPDAVPARPRAPQPPKTESTPGPENAVIPQIEVPLKRGKRKPEVLRPGADKVAGGVDDSAARCLATSNARRADCGAAAASAPVKAKGH